MAATLAELLASDTCFCIMCRQADVSFELQEPWSMAYEELAKNAAAELQQITKYINKQLEGRKKHLNWIPELSDLRLDDLAAAHQLVVLQAESEGPDNVISESSLQLTEEALQSFHAMWHSQDSSSSAIFVIVEGHASANSFYQNLEVLDKSALHAVLEDQEQEGKPEVWPSGRIAYIGMILRTDHQIQAVKRLLDPVIEPVLSLILSVEWGGTPLEMTVQMFMCNKADPEVNCASNIDCTRQQMCKKLQGLQLLAIVILTIDLSLLQVRLTSSNSKRTAVKDLIDDVAAELKARFEVDVDTAHCPQLLQISLQRDEGIDSPQDPQVTSTAPWPALC